jgi:hypothetical protein
MNSVVSSKSRSDCITFRIATEKLNQLRSVSEAKNVSLNTLVNQVIKAHLDWHSMAADAKLYYLPKSFLVRLVDQLTEDQIREVARDTAKNDLVEISLFLQGGFSIASLSNITETWLRISQMPYRLEINGDSSKIIIDHDMGYKYSYLIREISRCILEVALEAKMSCDITDNTVVLKLYQ